MSSDNALPDIDPAILAADPNTGATQLHQLAAKYPPVRPIIALNPNAYPALLEWFATLGEPTLDEALRRRAILFGEAPTPPATPDLPPAPTVSAPSVSAPTVSAPEASAATASSLTQAAPSQAASTQPAVTQAPVTPAMPAQVASTQPTLALPPAAGQVGAKGREAEYFSAPALSPSPHLRNNPAQPLAAPSTLYEVGVAGGEEERSTGSKILLILLTLMLVAVLVVGGFIVNFLAASPLRENQGATADPESSAAAAPEAGGAAPSTSDSASPSTSAESGEYPAPADALKQGSFTTKSGNTYCQIDEAGTICEIKNHEATIGECDPQTMVRLTLTAEKITYACDAKEGYVPGPGTIEYGQSIASGDFACTSLESGTECWNTKTGKGFMVARQGVTELSEGPEN